MAHLAAADVIFDGPFQTANELLKHQTILQLGDAIGGMTFFVIRERKNKRVAATSTEKKAVRFACKVCSCLNGFCWHPSVYILPR